MSTDELLCVPDLEDLDKYLQEVRAYQPCKITSFRVSRYHFNVLILLVIEMVEFYCIVLHIS